MKKIVGIHQPNFFPWLGYFRKISLCDHFVFLDDVQLNKESYTRRVQVRHPFEINERIWLTIPLKKSSHKSLINQLLIDHKKNWIEQHLEILKQTYEHAPYWDDLIEWLFPLYKSFSTIRSLSEININTIISVCELIDLSTTFSLSSDLHCSGVKDEYTFHLVNEVGGTHYVRGKGEQKYSSYAGWSEAGAPIIIDLENKKWTDEAQRDIVGHEIGTSILDALAWQGREVVKNFLTFP